MRLTTLTYTLLPRQQKQTCGRQTRAAGRTIEFHKKQYGDYDDGENNDDDGGDDDADDDDGDNDADHTLPFLERGRRIALSVVVIHPFAFCGSVLIDIFLFRYQLLP